MVLREVHEDLGERHRVVAGVGDARRPLELRPQLLERRVLHRPEGQGVLDHPVARARLIHLLAELGDRGNGESLEVHEDRVGRGLELAGELVDQFLLFRAIHVPLPAYAWPSTDVRSTLTPGPIVDDSAIDFTYFPLAAAGFALITESIRVLALSRSFSGPNETLPIGAWMIAVLSTRYSTLPALISRTALATSNVTVPVFGLGIRPRGPSTFPSLPTDFIMSGVATMASKSSQFSCWIRFTMSSPPMWSAPASWASFSFSPEATTSTFLALPPSPCGSMTVPRTIWSACLGSTPSRIATSTVSSNLANAAFVTVATASGSGYCGLVTASRAFVYFFPTFGITLLRQRSSLPSTAASSRGHSVVGSRPRRLRASPRSRPPWSARSRARC